MGNLEGEHTSKGMIIKPSRERGCKLAKIQRGEVYSNQTQKGWEVEKRRMKKKRKKRWRRRKSHYDAKRDDEIL